MKPLRLHAKTTLLVSAITLALFLATLFLVSLRMVNLAREDEKALAGLQGLSVAEQISLMTPPRDQDDLDRAVAQARAARPNVIAVRLWEQTNDGLIKRASAAEAGASDEVFSLKLGMNLSAGPIDRNGSSGAGPLRNFTIRKGGEIHYLVFAPVTEQGRFYGFVEVNERLDNIPSIVRSFAQTAALIALAAIILMTLAIYALFRYLVYHPMNGLDEAMARVKDGSLDARAPVSTQDEFGRLATGFNRMIERIRELTREREARQENLRERVREATAESRAAAERYRLIFDRNPLPMWVYDSTTLRFLTVNEAALQNYGWTRDEFLQMSIEDIRPAEDRDGLPPKSLEEVPSAGERERIGAARHQRKDGSLIDVEVLSHDLVFEGRQARLVIAADVTEKKRIEAGMARSQRLEALGTLASGIAHDLNNILSPLSISTFLLRSKVSDPGGRETLDTMEEVVERGSQIVKQVLSFARGAEGERVPLDPRGALGEVVSILKETFPKSIHIQYSGAGVSRTVLGDPTQLHQVLMNLCVNARDAMPQGGDLEITAEDIEIDAQYAQLSPDAKPGKYVMISVRDTGAGVPPQALDKIFDPFFTTKALGTGLGLSTSLGIVRNHGGFINVYSERGAGALFKVYLPALDDGAEAAEPDEEAEGHAGAGELILLVDDEEPIRRLTRGMLEASNYRVITASDGAEACAIYREKRNEIKLVLTDMIMPVMDGAAAISELRRLDPGLPIIASSGLAEIGKEAQALASGAQKFLPKPYTAVRLLRALNELLRGGPVTQSREWAREESR
ncbi:MAG: response regulator [Chloracidobacterium sp.]|nr:response regulator [Chloracidobacterium sp.]